MNYFNNLIRDGKCVICQQPVSQEDVQNHELHGHGCLTPFLLSLRYVVEIDVDGKTQYIEFDNIYNAAEMSLHGDGVAGPLHLKGYHRETCNYFFDLRRKISEERAEATKRVIGAMKIAERQLSRQNAVDALNAEIDDLKPEAYARRLLAIQQEYAEPQ